MINLNINVSIKPEQIIDAEYRRQFIKSISILHNEMADYGLPMQIKTPSIPRNPSNGTTKEKGPNELEFLATSGQSRMKVPSTWTGSREEYAASRLSGTVDSHDETEETEETTSGEFDTFH
jgi:hypothetical protein